MRKSQKLSQNQLSEKIGVSRQWVAEIENGKPRAEIGLICRFQRKGVSKFLDPVLVGSLAFLMSVNMTTIIILVLLFQFSLEFVGESG